MSSWVLVADTMSQMLPHAGAALVVACIALTLARRFSTSLKIRTFVFTSAFALCLIPTPEYAISHFARVLTGDLSMTSLAWLGFVACRTLLSDKPARSNAEMVMAIVIVIAAVVLYPTALGFTMFDAYASGYHPNVLAPLIFILFSFCLWFGQWLPMTILATVLATYQMSWLESDNLWDYVIDPVIVIYAVSILVKERHRIRELRLAETHLEVLCGLTLIIFLSTALVQPVASLL